MLMKKSKTSRNAAIYESPGIEVIDTPRQVLLCQSNGSLDEIYLGDGGFTEQ